MDTCSISAGAGDNPGEMRPWKSSPHPEVLPRHPHCGRGSQTGMAQTLPTTSSHSEDAKPLDVSRQDLPAFQRNTVLII